ncbi:MAG: acyl-phosphate glycerol 3-phosphate acyltransferase [Elusimicrobia bacterium RIFCSPLOWO2_01_FULL_59_12]|nr:MAG: acyl-phosphate glycerol 3-phosphate acyltransferase [Elusimicrobia bacterium RIFCSPLOWO2_01_FULL_59_12]
MTPIELQRGVSYYLPFTLLSYLIGAIPTGYWLGKLWKGVDVRRRGSGNLGATNVFRVLGIGPGIVTLLVDVAKGAVPVVWIQNVDPDALGLAVVAGLAAIAGHTASLFVGFRGGKGVATSAGVFAALLPVPSVIALAAFLLSLAMSRRVSVGSIVAAVTLAGTAFIFSPDPLRTYTAAAVACLVIWTHRGNIKRILAGTEPRIGNG